MMEVATKTPNVADVIGSIAWKVQAKGVSLIRHFSVRLNVVRISYVNLIGPRAVHYIFMYRMCLC